MGDINRIKEELVEALHKIMMEETRLWLLNRLLKLELVTWDIYYFASKQADLRSTLKSLNWPTMKAALKIKIKDTLVTLTLYRREKSRLELAIRNLTNLASIKHLTKPMNKPINKERKKV